MKEIQLTQEKVALVDDDDFDQLNLYSWQAVRAEGGLWYAIRSITTQRTASGKSTVKMHRAIVNASADVQIDHRDGNGLNNTRANLRIATSTQNCANGPARNGKRYKGVYYRPGGRRYKPGYQAGVRHKGIWHGAGFYTMPEDAARAYDRKAQELFGEFARLNFPRKGEKG